jgi:2-polyprenyl-3-methyl-5-hydroxy-6-metoxy-1,4-benzoquinol methylase
MAMRINLLYDSPDIRSGYVNVDPFSIDNPDKICCDLQELSFCSVGEAQEILCIDILSQYNLEDASKIFSELVSKLAHGGSITISDLNAYEVARIFTVGKLTPTDFSQLLFGHKHPKKSIHSIDTIVQGFGQFGLQITAKKLEGYKFSVTGVRP